MSAQKLNRLHNKKDHLLGLFSLKGFPTVNSLGLWWVLFFYAAFIPVSVFSLC